MTAFLCLLTVYPSNMILQDPWLSSQYKHGAHKRGQYVDTWINNTYLKEVICLFDMPCKTLVFKAVTREHGMELSSL